jgi:hypothetical protein
VFPQSTFRRVHSECLLWNWDWRLAGLETM